MARICTSSQVTKEEESYFQNFQLILDIGKALKSVTSWFIILEYRLVIASKIEDKSKCIQLVGMKYLITSNDTIKSQQRFQTIYEGKTCLAKGTRIIYRNQNQERSIDMENFEN